MRKPPDKFISFTNLYPLLCSGVQFKNKISQVVLCSNAFLLKLEAVLQNKTEEKSVLKSVQLQSKQKLKINSLLFSSTCLFYFYRHIVGAAAYPSKHSAVGFQFHTGIAKR